MASKKPTVKFEWLRPDGTPLVGWSLLDGDGVPLCGSPRLYPDRASAAKDIERVVILLQAARRSGPGEKPAAPEVEGSGYTAGGDGGVLEGTNRTTSGAIGQP